ncbi:MAG: helix-turn-helix transcriptional regulator [Rhodocyclaceae bacterium]|nr:helix-turn-helix transcriptional regulator [Rhodocyclaceae bacterium]
MEPKFAFAKVIRRLRIQAGLTQEQLGFDADLRRTYISILELGQQQPSLATVFKLASALKISASVLIAEVEQEMAGTGMPYVTQG